jgi:hypothetical protein
VGPRAGLDDLENRKFLNLPGFELRSLSRPARSQSLYRLCHHVKLILIKMFYNLLNNSLIWLPAWITLRS